MAKPICKKCGGTLYFEECRLCELLESGDIKVFVEKERMNNQKISEAIGCHASQVKDFREDAKRKGVPTQFTNDGRAIFTSRQHQRDYCKAYGYTNRDGSYGD